MNKQKHAEVKGFLTWLERRVGARLDGLSNKTRLRAYYENDFDVLLAVLAQNRRKLKIDPDARAEQEIIEREFSASAAKLAPLRQKLAYTDELIDLIVFRLYGLDGDKIATVKRNAAPL